MIVFPKAKINLGLHITGKRTDGYHDIETIFYPVNLNDALEFVVSDENTGKDSLLATGISAGCIDDDNLVMKAVRKLREQYPFPFLKLHLHKAIPPGAGLGGGSSDAVCILKSIIRYFELKTNNSILKSIALELGSDCPFFIDAAPSYATGRGEILTPVEPLLEGYYMLLLNPGVGINTGEAYRNCKPMTPITSLSDLYYKDINTWGKTIRNDFEDYAFNKHNIIRSLKNELYGSGALFSLMSGSGSSVFGIFCERPSVNEKLKPFVIWQGML